MATMTTERAQVGAPPRSSALGRKMAPYLYILPALVIMTIITYYPIGYNIWMSFTNYGIKNLRADAPAPDWVGVDNYIQILTGSLSALIPNFNFWSVLSF